MTNKKQNKFLNEYPCTFIEEHDFLKSKGFKYNFVKIVDGITTWKYSKSSELYDALKEYYTKNK